MKNWMKKHKGIAITAVVVVVVAVAAVFVLPRLGGDAEAQQQEIKQNTVELTKMDLTRSISATGTLESTKTKLVSADVSNVRIKKVLVKVGDEVKKGQSLVTFDKSDLQQALDDAEENLFDVKSQNSTELAAAERKLEEAQETYNDLQESQSKENSSSENSSSTKTSAGQTTTQNTESQGTSLSQSKSNVESAKESLTSLKTTQKKSLREAQQAVDDAKEALEKCSATAPMDGTVTAIGASAGDSYQGGDLIEISDCTNLRVSTSVDEYDISDVAKGQKVVILTDATGDEELEGKITYVAPTTGSTLSSSGTSSSAGGSGSAGSSSMGSSSAGSSGTTSSGYEVRIKLQSTNEKLRIGMTAKCSIILEEASDVYAVPYDAIHTNTNGDSVLYVKDSSGTRSEVTVTKGMESDYYVEVSGEGLSEGLQIMIPTDDTSSTTRTENSGTGLDSLMQGAGGNKPNRGYNKSGGAPGGAPGM